MGYRIMITVLVISFNTLSAEQEEILFEEEMTEQERPCHHHYHLPRYNPEEERHYLERSDAPWPGKREDTLMDELTHY